MKIIEVAYYELYFTIASTLERPSKLSSVIVHIVESILEEVNPKAQLIGICGRVVNNVVSKLN